MTKKKTRGRDKEEVRFENPVPDLLAKYGVQVKGNRYKPFCHASGQFSGKVFRDSCHCYVCNKSFDCFSIVGWFEGISSLPDQIKFLGGEELDIDDPVAKKRKKEAEERRRKIEESKRKAEERDRRIASLTEYILNLKKAMAMAEKKDDATWARAYARAQAADYELGMVFDGSTAGAGMLDDIRVPDFEIA